LEAGIVGHIFGTMGNVDLAISTAFAEVDRMFTAAAEGAAAGECDANITRQLGVLAHRLGALSKHATMRLRTITRYGPVDCEESRDAAALPPDCDEPHSAIPQPRTGRAPHTPEHAIVEVSPGVELPAVLCSARAGATPSDEPWLRYDPDSNQFAFRIGAHVLRGNVGRVFPPGTCRPEGVKPCDPGLCTGQLCTYYHPDKNVASSGAGCGRPDIRNFTAGSFVYAPRGATCNRKYGGRAIGDVDALYEDLHTLTRDDARLFLDQVVHDTLCAAAILHNRPDLADRT
jgi:hypothetical protein